MVWWNSKLIIVLDSNEYINFLNKKSLDINKILSNENIIIYVNELIIREVLRNIKETLKREFYKILLKDKIILYNEKLPFNLFKKYKRLGFKKGDIEIAAFCENIGADCLIAENRHFLKSKRSDKFDIVTMRDFLAKI